MSQTLVLINPSLQRIPTAGFVPVQLEHRPFAFHPTGRSGIIHVATDDVSRTAHIRDALLRQIRSAHQKVQFCSFLFADERIVTALCEASERLHGGVYVLTALGTQLKSQSAFIEEEATGWEKQTAERVTNHNRYLAMMARAGVWLRSNEGCHAKFSVVDDSQCVVTSANCTEDAFEANPEDGLVITDAAIASEFGRLFAHIWLHRTDQEAKPSGGLNVGTFSQPKAPPHWKALTAMSDVRPVCTLMEAEHSIQAASVEVVASAKETLTVATFSLFGIENLPIGEAFSVALARGVSIDLLLRSQKSHQHWLDTCAWLIRKAPDRVRIIGHPRTHTKSIVADRATALMWTGNLEEKGWTSGIEVGLVARDPGIAAALEDYVRGVMSRGTTAVQLGLEVARLAPLDGTRALTGEWVLQLRPRDPFQRILAALKTGPAEVFVRGPVHVIRVPGILALEAFVDEEKRIIQAGPVLDPRAEVNGRRLGWLASDKFRIELENGPGPEPGPAARHGGPARRSGPGNGRGNRRGRKP